MASKARGLSLVKMDCFNRSLTILRLHGPLASILFLIAALLSFIVGAPASSVSLSVTSVAFILIVWGYDNSISKEMLPHLAILSKSRSSRKSLASNALFMQFPRMPMRLMVLLYFVIGLAGTSVTGTFITISFPGYIALYYTLVLVLWAGVIFWISKSIQFYKKSDLLGKKFS